MWSSSSVAAVALAAATALSGCGAAGDDAAVDVGDRLGAAADPLTGAAPFTVRFAAPRDAGPPATGASYSWDFGDGSPISALAPAVHTYREAGLYAAMLTISGAQGPPSTHVAIISVQGHPEALEPGGADRSSP